MELLIKEEAGDINEDDVQQRRLTEEKVERLEIFTEKFGVFLKELKIKCEIGKVGYERLKDVVIAFNILFGQDKDTKPKELFGLFIEFAKQFLQSAEKLKIKQENEEKKRQVTLAKEKKEAERQNMLPRQSIQVLDLKIQKKKSETKEKPGLMMPDKQKLLEILQGGKATPTKDPL